ncbi:hypothetical protein MRB53_031836 [Persea americana]|uniref:Uncharacterized protein n=1 Tax=Persea americana TaxID=3435 RepID=A0ACC2KQ89_PERAE|nr:hypothetical protein MRB53_031836 [Persea americana]
MAMKRLFSSAAASSDEIDDEQPRERKRPTLHSVGREVIAMQLMQRWLVPVLEPLIRRVVREEVEHAFIPSFPTVLRPSTSINRIQAPEGTGLKLLFNTSLSDTLFTGSRITTQVEIQSGNSEVQVTTGPLSSIKVEIVVLDGDFGKDENVSWTKEDFSANVVREREGRRPLLTGELVVALRNGVGTFGNVTFTDNSSWIRSRRFRLGVRVVESSATKERIREARSEPFVVKDHRGELYKKHDSPSLRDEIWRLKNIGKDGVFCKRLIEKGIKTVQQFLRFLVTNPDELRTILGQGMSNKVWEETRRHARKCILDDKSYTYFSARQGVGLLLNSIYEVKMVTFDGQNFLSLDSLDQYQKILVENLKKEAYENQEGIHEFNELLPFFGPSRPLSEPQPPIPDTGPSLQNLDSITRQNELALLDFMSATNPQLQNFTVHLSQLKDVLAPDFHTRQLFAPMQSDSFNMLEVDQPHQEHSIISQDLQLSQAFAPSQSNTLDMNDSFYVPYGAYGNRWFESGSAGTSASDRHFLGNCNYPQVQMLNLLNGSHPVLNDEMRAASLLSHLQSSDLSAGSLGMVKPKGWRKLGAPLKWGILVRKDVAARRMAESCT